MIGQLGGTDTAHHDNIPAGEHIGPVQAIELTKPAADTVADHGVAQLGGDGDAQAAHSLSVLQAVDHHAAGDGGPAPAVNAAEVAVLLHRYSCVHSSLAILVLPRQIHR